MTQTIGFGGKLVAGLVAIGACAGIAWGGADEGKALYDKQCKLCHSIKGEGGKMADKGGALDGVGTKHDAKWLKAYLSDPKSVMPDAKMPKPKLSDQQLDDLVAYMLTLK
jgi:mono/diheme cytochrome c family protein